MQLTGVTDLTASQSEHPESPDEEYSGEEDGEQDSSDDEDVVLAEACLSELQEVLDRWGLLSSTIASSRRWARLEAGVEWTAIQDPTNEHRALLRNRKGKRAAYFPAQYLTALQLLNKHITFQKHVADRVEEFLGDWKVPPRVQLGPLGNPWDTHYGAVQLGLFLISIRQSAITWQAKFDKACALNSAQGNFNPWLQVWAVAVYRSPRDYTVSLQANWQYYVSRTEIGGKCSGTLSMLCTHFWMPQTLTGVRGRRGSIATSSSSQPRTSQSRRWRRTTSSLTKPSYPCLKRRYASHSGFYTLIHSLR